MQTFRPAILAFGICRGKRLTANGEMEVEMKIPRRHIFVCTARFCANNKSEEVLERFRQEIAQRGLSDVKLTPCGSVGMCDIGPTVIIYPEGVWYVGVNSEDVPEILEGKPVERLRITPDHPEELKRKDFYNKLVDKVQVSEEELKRLAEETGFSEEWLNNQFISGFIEVQGTLFQASSKTKGRYIGG